MYDDLIKIVEFRHDRPYDVLGPHHNKDKIIIRTFIPDADEVSVFIKRPLKKVVRMKKILTDGLFEASVAIEADTDELDYVLRVTDFNQQRHVIRDAYNFVPSDFEPDQEARFLSGNHNCLSDRLGAHLVTEKSIPGVRFGIWAPNAQRVSVVGNFNRWDGRRHPMQRISNVGIWELFIPDVKDGDYYKFEIQTANGDVFLKTDPFAFQIEDSPEAAAIVYALAQAHHWQEDDRKPHADMQAVAVYKVDEPESQTTKVSLELSDDKLGQLRKRGYSHLEIPNCCDWQSEVATFFSPNPTIGTPAQVQSLIDRCHRQGLGVIIDVIPLSLVMAQKNLAFFDGGPLYEQQQKQQQVAFRFDTENPGVKSFLLSYARFWRENYRIDGFRLNTENHLLYRDLITTCSAENANMLWLVHEPEPGLTLTKDVFKRLFHHHRVDNPFSILGPNKHPAKKTATIRAILPAAQQAYVYFPDQSEVWYEMLRLCDEGLWQAIIPPCRLEQAYRLHAIDQNGKHHDFLDTYAFDVSYISEGDKIRFAEGNHYHIYSILGAHLQHCAGVEGVNFAVWAPNAAAVNVVGDFNQWEGFGHPLRLHPESGIWELFVPAIGNGERYQYEIHPQNGNSFLKSDPYAFYMETAPATESVVYQIDDIYHWHDHDWMQQRRQTNVWRSPVSIYEVHLGSWMRGPGKRLLNYTKIAERLIPYVKEMGFTHIEILPIAEHPYEPSWGYQVSNFYAPTSRLGKPEELMAFVDQCHQNGIGVLLDWVAGHFPKDAHALAKFDGTHLYEHEDPRKGEHKDWGTLIFNYGRHEVENFLIANALFWLDYYHFDGLRVDAVASMLYLDYSRKAGEWIPNIYGGNENLEAIEFLKHTNYIVHGRFPGSMMIAEESTAWAGVSKPTDSGGLGFGFKWNMGWMHDVLSYLQTPPEYRKYHHNRLAFVFHYAFEENFILSLSHDEVVHLKGSLYTKMPGCEWEKFANLRLLFFFMFTHPGKKLNFMGAEFAQIQEWNESDELQWSVLENDPNQRLQQYLKTLNRLYRNEPVLHQMDCRPAGFEWIDGNNNEQSIIAFTRKAKDPRITLIVVINFSAISRFNYRIGVPYPVSYTQVLNSNDVRFGGLSLFGPDTTFTIDDIPWHGQEFSIEIDKLPALSALLLRPAAPL